MCILQANLQANNISNHLVHFTRCTMDATYRMSLQELTPEFIAALKTTFANTAQAVETSLHVNSEPVDAELLRRIYTIERRENLISFEGEELSTLAKQLLSESGQ